MNKKIYYYPSEEQQAKQDFSYSLLKMMEENHGIPAPIIILCIGTDKVTGDSLGPFVGHRLCQMLNDKPPALPVRIYGTLKEPVHAINLNDTLEDLKKKLANDNLSLKDCLLLVVDASLGISSHLGYVTLSNQPLSPGEGVNKKLPRIGQISITGIIGEAKVTSYKSQQVLRQTRLYDLIKLADFISEGIYESLTHLTLKLPLVYLDRIPNRRSPLLFHNGN